jgi:hypothetical protein
VKKKATSPGSYNTMSHYYPAEQINIVKEMKFKTKKK